MDRQPLARGLESALPNRDHKGAVSPASLLTQSFDVVVAGGGPAGSATALNLSRRGLSVPLIEQGKYEAPRVGETLPPLSRQRLTELGVDDPWDWRMGLLAAQLERH